MTFLPEFSICMRDMAFFHGRGGIFKHELHWANAPSSSPPQPGQRLPCSSGSSFRHSVQKLLKSWVRCVSHSQSGQGNSQRKFNNRVKIFIYFLSPEKTKGSTGKTAEPLPCSILFMNWFQTCRLLAFCSAFDQSCHAGFAAGEVCLAATTFDDLVVLLTHDEPTFFCYVKFFCLFSVTILR